MFDPFTRMSASLCVWIALHVQASGLESLGLPTIILAAGGINKGAVAEKSHDSLESFLL